jgi:hypothetical protein
VKGDEAVMLARGAIALRGERPSYLETLSRACDAKGDKACAVERFHKLLASSEALPFEVKTHAEERLKKLAPLTPEALRLRFARTGPTIGPVAGKRARQTPVAARLEAGSDRTPEPLRYASGRAQVWRSRSTFLASTMSSWPRTSAPSFTTSFMSGVSR